MEPADVATFKTMAEIFRAGGTIEGRVPDSLFATGPYEKAEARAMSAATVVAAAGRPARVPLIVQRLALALLLLGAWWLISLAVPPYVLPQPERVFARIVQLTQSGDLPINLLTTLGRVLAGFALAVAIGVPGGILLGSHRALGDLLRTGPAGAQHGIVGDLGDLRHHLVRAVADDADLRGADDGVSADRDQCLAGHARR